MATKQGCTDVKIRNVPNDVVHRIDQQARQGSFSSREAYLREKLGELSLQELNLEAESRYQMLIRDLLKTLNLNTEQLKHVRELYNIVLAGDDDGL